MDERQAMQIMCNKNAVIGKCDGDKVIVSREDIKTNLECNDFELNLGFIQDFTRISKNGDYEWYQGRSLSEIEVNV